MNTKGIKFLAVLAVLAMAFAAFTVITTAELNDAEFATPIDVSTETEALLIDPEEVNSNAVNTLYFSEDAVVKVKDSAASLTVYVDNGSTVELKFTEAGTVVDVVTVSGDRTSKKAWTDSEIQFATTASSTFEYTGVSITAKGALVDDTVATFYFSGVMNLQKSGEKVAVASGEEITLSGELDANNSLLYGVMYYENGWVLSAPGDKVSTYSLDGTHAVKIRNGTITVTYEGSSAVFDAVKNSDGVDVSTGVIHYDPTTYAYDADVDVKAIKIVGSPVKGKGTITLTGNVLLEMTENAGKIIVGKDTVVRASAAIANGMYGQFVLNSKIPVYLSNEDTAGIKNTSGTVYVNNKALWDGSNDAAVVLGIDTSASEGLIDTSGATTVGELQLEIESQTIYPKQTYNVTKDTIVTGNLDVHGILVINEGVTLTIDKGAQMEASGKYAQVINNGTIIVKVKPTTADGTKAEFTGQDAALYVASPATFINNGTMTTSSGASLSQTVPNADAMDISSDNFANYGTMNVNASDIVDITKGWYSGEINVSGQVYGEITLGGVLTVSGSSQTNNLKVHLSLLGASYVINQVTVAKESTIIVDNSYTVCSNGTTYGHTKVTITPTIADGKVIYLGGMTFVAGEDKSGSTYSGKIVLSGSPSVTTNDTDTQLTSYVTVASERATVADVAGKLSIESPVAIPNKMTVTVSDLKVTDDLHALNGSSLAITNIVSVSGEIYGLGVTAPAGGNYASYYANSSINMVYTSLTNAVEGIKETTSNVITINGANSLSADLTIPAGYMIVGTGTLTVGSTTNAKPTLTIEATAGFSAGTIKCYGSVYAANENNLVSAVYADAKVKNGSSVLYTNLANAVTNGMTIELLKGPANGEKLTSKTSSVLSSVDITGVVITSDLIVPAGVTIDVNDTTNTITVLGSEFTVNGKLVIPYNKIFVYDSHVNEASVAVDEGFFMTKTADTDNFWWYPDGVHYVQTIQDDKYYVTTAIENIGIAIADSDDSEISITAAETIPDVTIAGTESKPAVLTIAGTDVKTGTITVSYATVKFVNGIETLTTTIANGDGLIALENARPVGLKFVEDGDLTITGAVYDPEVWSDRAVSGAYYKSYEETYKLTFMGETYTEKFTAYKWDGQEGDPTSDVPGAGAREYLPASGIESPVVTVSGDLTFVGRSNTFYPNVTIIGTALAENSSRVTFEGEVYVLGSLAANEKTEGSASGVIYLDGDAYIGATKWDIFSKKVLETSDLAILAGDVNLKEGAFLYAYAGSIIANSIVEDLKSASFQIDGIEFLEIFSTAGTKDVKGLFVPLDSGAVVMFTDIDGEEIVGITIGDEDDDNKIFSNESMVFIDSYNIQLDTEGTVYNAIVDYEIYTVNIKTDGSIKAVYIDGALMITSSMANVFTKSDITTGTHKITVEPATGYDASKCYLYLDDGTKLTGMTFTFSAEDCKKSSAGDYYVEYNVAGTEVIPTPEPEPVTPEEKSEWTITTILLCILVILIAIMAVIVALRLNRN